MANPKFDIGDVIAFGAMGQRTGEIVDIRQSVFTGEIVYEVVRIRKDGLLGNVVFVEENEAKSPEKLGR